MVQRWFDLEEYLVRESIMFKKEKKLYVNSFDRLFQIVLKGDNIDDQLFDLADKIISGRPVLAVFTEITDEKIANYIATFLSGVCYALDGKVCAIGTESYLFASNESLKDGSIEQYINEVVKS